jgi:hypothetical protein
MRRCAAPSSWCSLMILLAPRHSTSSAPPPAPVSLPPGELTGGRGAPPTNAQKQERWRRRNQIVLGDDADDIAAKLIGLDRRILRRIVNLDRAASEGDARAAEGRRAQSCPLARKRAPMAQAMGGRGAFAHRLPRGHQGRQERGVGVAAGARAGGQCARTAWLDDHPGKALPSTCAR